MTSAISKVRVGVGICALLNPFTSRPAGPIDGTSQRDGRRDGPSRHAFGRRVPWRLEGDVWLLFGSDSSIKRLLGGTTFKHQCGQCGRTATFYPCEATSSVSVWGIDLLSDREQVVQCG